MEARVTQRSAIKMIKGLGNLLHERRLKEMGFSALRKDA